MYFEELENGKTKLVYVKKPNYDELIEIDKKNKIEKDKLEHSISRSKTIINEYALCNQWQYFVTITINKEKMDRYDVQAYRKKLSSFINHYNRDNNCKLKYLLIPELHSDGAIHMHGLFSDVPEFDLELFTLEHNIPKKLKKLILAGRVFYNWLPYAEKFGWVTFEKIQSNVAISFYILKYVTKKPAIEELGKHLYFCSHGLSKAQKIKEGVMVVDQYISNLNNLYSNAYVTTGYTDNPSDILNLLNDNN